MNLQITKWKLADIIGGQFRVSQILVKTGTIFLFKSHGIQCQNWGQSRSRKFNALCLALPREDTKLPYLIQCDSIIFLLKRTILTEKTELFLTFRNKHQVTKEKDINKIMHCESTCNYIQVIDKTKQRKQMVFYLFLDLIQASLSLKGYILTSLLL